MIFFYDRVNDTPYVFDYKSTIRMDDVLRWPLTAAEDSLFLNDCELPCSLLDLLIEVYPEARISAQDLKYRRGKPLNTLESG